MFGIILNLCKAVKAHLNLHLPLQVTLYHKNLYHMSMPNKLV